MKRSYLDRIAVLCLKSEQVLRQNGPLAFYSTLAASVCVAATPFSAHSPSIQLKSLSSLVFIFGVSFGVISPAIAANRCAEAFSMTQAKQVHLSVSPDNGAAEALSNGMIPRGSALITRAGNLRATGIRAIIHAATGSMTRQGGIFEPTLLSIQESINSSLELARANGFKRVAIPFIGGGIFSERLGVSLESLADLIVKSSLQESHGLELRFVTFGNRDTSLFKDSLSRQREITADASVLDGSITDFSLHGASAILNAANMEVQFGGGLSGVIGRATGQHDKINEEARFEIQRLRSLEQLP